MLEKMLHKLALKENLVFVGSVAMMLQGIDVKPKDIDIVVTDLNGLENYTEYSTDSKFSFTGKRAFIIDEINIDIFIEQELPEFVIINGLKCETFFYMKRFYNVILPKVDDYWKRVINEKLKLLE
ncbi:hypothetical protein [Chryseobacterium daeguense]|uniref:hypothetical protein n=1 Tax=Chryseobacterium daeguense TaxID=412438 RepID=UPI00048421E5|nr:hypothetical protein [Chryseobacterium daeguense]